MLIEAFEEQVAPAFPRAKLVIAGTNSSNLLLGYIEGLSAKYASLGIEFKGYVEEHDKRRHLVIHGDAIYLSPSQRCGQLGCGLW